MGMLFLSFRASLSSLASSRPICLFHGPVIHYSCCLGLMVLPSACQFFAALIVGLFFFLLGFSQMTLNSHQPLTFFVFNTLGLPWPILTFSHHILPIVCFSFYSGSFKPIYLFKAHMFISWVCDLLFLSLGLNGFSISLLTLFCLCCWASPFHVGFQNGYQHSAISLLGRLFTVTMMKLGCTELCLVLQAYRDESFISENYMSD